MIVIIKYKCNSYKCDSRGYYRIIMKVINVIIVLRDQIKIVIYM